MFRNLGILVLIVFMLCNCGTQHKPGMRGKASENDTLKIVNDSLEYEVIIIEPGFNSWLATQPPRGHYAQSTLEMRNRLMVQEYNLRVRSPQYNQNLYPFQIDYEADVDYGYEVNYLLYNYFLFFEQRYNQKLR